MEIGDGFYAVKFGGRWFDVGVAKARVVLASAHDGGDIPWEAFAKRLGTWTNASPFPVPSETEVATTPPDATKPKKPARDDTQDIIDEALSLAEEINNTADDVPERGQEFAESVRGRANDIAETVEEKGFATEKQIDALRNMLSGLERWIR